MLTTRRETAVLSSSKGLWLPGKRPPEDYSPVGAVAPVLSARAEEIARSRDELLGLLRHLPESELELSLTDLVERSTVSGEDQEPARKVVKREERMINSKVGLGSSRWRWRKRSSSDGVLLNFYVPKSIGRSFTWSGGRDKERNRTAAAAVAVGAAAGDGIKTRDKDLFFTGCWPITWHKGWGKRVKRN